MRLIDLWEREAKAFQQKTVSASANAALNKKVFLIARDFYLSAGLPGHPTERNLWAGSDGTLPGLAAALEAKDTALLQKQTNIYIQALQKRVKSLRSLF